MAAHGYQRNKMHPAKLETILKTSPSQQEQMKKFATILTLVVLTLACGWVAARLLFPKFNVFEELKERTPGELLRYTLTRLDGHSTLEAIFDPPLYQVQKYLEPPLLTPLGVAQGAGKGQQKQSLPVQQFGPAKQPLPVNAAEVHAHAYQLPTNKASGREWLVTASRELPTIMAQAKAGDVITLQPGEYDLGGGKTGQSGRPDAPIYLRAEQPGTVHIRLAGLFYVTQPYWIFENLNLQGNCRHSGGPCEHAFHVVGAAEGTVIRNNLLHDFYAHIKVNGLNGRFPNKGLVQFNTLSNGGNIGFSALAPFDLVGASDWNFSDNLVHHFVKAWSPHASYGVFMKGGGSRGRIERNMVVCTGDGAISHYGSRVGISMGGGLTEARFCPDKRCLYEHADGLIANNLVMNCNDFGIDNNTSLRTVAAHNTLFNTYGIDSRGIPSTLYAYGNHLSGHVIRKRGGEIEEKNNDKSLDTTGVMKQGASVFLGRLQNNRLIPTHPAVKDDFCGRQRGPESQTGALTISGACQVTSR